MIDEMKFKNSNKGQAGKLVSIILILAGAIIMYMFVMKFNEKATFDEAINACRLSVLAQSTTEILPSASGAKSPFSISCDRRYLDIYNTHVDIGLSPEHMKPLEVTYGGRKTTRFKTLTDSIVNQAIAEEMRICKYQFADGKIDIFGNDDTYIFDQTVCFICSEINFKNVDIDNVDTFVEYTKKATFGKDQTYYDYFTEKTVTGNTLWSQPEFEASFWDKIWTGEDGSYGNLTIDPSKKYVIFIEKMGKNTIPVTIVDVLDTDEPIYLAIMPADKINTYCEIQAS